jgi:hypothetical protein
MPPYNASDLLKCWLFSDASTRHFAYADVRAAKLSDMRRREPPALLRLKAGTDAGDHPKSVADHRME